MKFVCINLLLLTACTLSVEKLSHICKFSQKAYQWCITVCIFSLKTRKYLNNVKIRNNLGQRNCLYFILLYFIGSE